MSIETMARTAARFRRREARTRRRKTGRSATSAALLAAVGAVVGLPGGGLVSASPASAQASPITIAYITSVTGQAAPEDSNSVSAFKARLAVQNAAGGVHGHKLVPLVIDDQTSPTSIESAVQDADSKAFGIVSQSPLFFLAAKYPQQQGIPVTGSYDDGPEWGSQPYTNMFAADQGSLDPKYPANSLTGTFLKSKGATVLGTYGYGISPSSSRAAIQSTDSFKHAGGSVGVLNTTVPFGSVDYTADALVAKRAHVDALVPEMDDNSNFALAEAYKQAGIKLKASLFATGYEPSVINSPAWPALQGDYFVSLFRPFSLPNAGTQQMQAALEKYANFTKTQFPTYSQYEAWLGADLMIKGLEMAGSNPSKAGVIKAIRSITSYDGNGLLPQSFDYKTDFGHDNAQQCFWFVQATKSGFTPVSSKPECGKDIAGTDTAS